MKLPEHEREAHRAAFREMNVAEKADYIFAYYKLPLVLILIAVVAIGSAIHIKLTHKDALLYVALTNVADDEQLDVPLNDGYVTATERDPRKCEVYCYHALYLSDPNDTADHQYSYASRMKVMASIAAEELDVVIMNRDAYDLLSHSGYLMDLLPVLADDPTLGPLLVTNTVILSDNMVEVELGEADTYEAETTEEANAIDASSMPLFADYTGEVYLGVIGNTPRLDEVCSYLNYLSSAR